MKADDGVYSSDLSCVDVSNAKMLCMRVGLPLVTVPTYMQGYKLHAVGHFLRRRKICPYLNAHSVGSALFYLDPRRISGLYRADDGCSWPRWRVAACYSK